MLMSIGNLLVFPVITGVLPTIIVGILISFISIDILTIPNSVAIAIARPLAAIGVSRRHTGLVGIVAGLDERIGDGETV
jgi:hypothetical protein